MQSEIVGTGIPFAEGPVWCPDGTVVVTSVAGGALYRVWPELLKTERIAVTTGGANGAALASDGSIIVTQNGGIDYSQLPIPIDLPACVPTIPGLQLAAPDGTVTYLANQDLHGPNDVAVHADGDIYFTDPGHYPPPEHELIGRVMVYGRDGSLRVFADQFQYCNGIAFDRDGAVVVVERRGLQRVFADGSREWVIEILGKGGGDGFCLDADGRFYVASTIEHGIRVVDTDGTVLDFLPIQGKGITTNCCFGGPDLRTLFVADAIPGNLVAFEHMPTPGLPLPVWPGRL
ncbi:MAG TPA: SMP-30/gluconolactonase/LRE family protein [Acidimicrobiia bacterium]|jgi:gluconolactonase|nr:SMP-30/gluconolactonase/LRE family protein [Acidimicrobiia bacterium]